MSNINQWKFDVLPNSKVIITEPVFYRLCLLIGRTSWIASEHKSTLFGRRLEDANTWVLDDINENEDYISEGSNSTNPYDYAANFGEKQYDEMMSKVKSGTVVVDVHTHPFGLISDFRFISGADQTVAKNLNKLIGEKGGIAFSGLIGCDRDYGNMSFSIIWYNKNDDKFYRIQNIYLRQKNKLGEYRDVPFVKYGECQLLMQNWGADNVVLQLM